MSMIRLIYNKVRKIINKDFYYDIHFAKLDFQPDNKYQQKQYKVIPGNNNRFIKGALL